MSNKLTALRRALALLLVLVIGAALPAMGEEVAIDLEDDAQAGAFEVEGLEIEELPALSDGDLELSGDIDLAEDIDLALEEAEPDSVEENTSKPIPDFKAYIYRFNVKNNRKFTMNLQDDLYLTTPESDIVRWQNSDDVIVRIKRNGNAKNSVFVQPTAVGTTTITLRLANRREYRFTVTVKDGYALKKFSLSRNTATVLVGQDIDLKQFMIIEPEYAKFNINVRTSDKSIASMSRDWVLTGLKPGRVTLTAFANYRFKALMSVTVKANRTDTLEAEPTAEDFNKLAKKWTLSPKSLELKGDGSIVCELWLLNGSDGKLTTLNNLDLAISTKDNTGNTLIARSAFKSMKVDCAENKSQVVTLTFPAKSVNCPQAFPGLKAKDLSFIAYDTPVAISSGSVKTPAYQPTSVVLYQKTPRNPVQYRALLISESDFYNPENEDPKKRWEHITRNKGDVELMKTMLSQVKTPEGGKFAVTTKDNTTDAQIKALIKKTFAYADENDVSLFFIATHGDSSETAGAINSGALRMASLSETSPEFLTLSELRDLLVQVPGKVIVILESCGSGAAVYKSNSRSDTKKELVSDLEAFDAQVVDTFRNADPGLVDSEYAANTGELRKVNKFYVLTASAYREESWGKESPTPGGSYNDFTHWLTQGVGKSGSMPADTQFAGNENGIVDLHELYRYISGVGDRSKIKTQNYKDVFFYQHVQVYPSDVRFPLFK